VPPTPGAGGGRGVLALRLLEAPYWPRECRGFSVEGVKV
jgi:hypothetical protein